MPHPRFPHPAPPIAMTLGRDELITLLADALLPDWAGMERLLDLIEGREVRP